MARGASSRFAWVAVLRRPDGSFWRQVIAGDELLVRRVFERTRERWSAAVRCDFVGCTLVLLNPGGREVDRWDVQASSGAA